jgi:hypothetical protein
LDPSLWAQEITGFSLDGWQKRALRSPAGRLLLNCCRQSGKSTVAALLALWTALYCRGSLSLLVSPSLRQSSELFKSVLGFYQGEPDAESALRLELENGSRILSLPGSERTVRGYSGVDLLVIDEAARVEDDLYRAVRPMLAVSGGRLLALSTPFGQRGWWFEAWQSGDQWERYQVTAEQCPRIAPEFLEEERRELGEQWYLQEYFCIFAERAGRVFSFDLLQAAQQEQVTMWAV